MAFINTKVSVKTTGSLELKKGIIANNDIMSYEEFYTFFKPQLEENFKSLQSRFNQIAGHIKGGRYKKAYIMWENIEKDILLNTNYTVSLLFIENINSDSGNYIFKYNSSEREILNDRGKLTRLKNLSEELFKENIAEQISTHLNEFIQDIQNSTLSENEILEIYNGNDASRKYNAAMARWHTGDYTYRNIFFGNNPVWQGNAADAFMNHMGHMHAQILAGTFETDEEKSLFASSVFQEEKSNVFNLLKDSTNNISWITGGDIIVKYGNQLLNIQLKTGQERKNGQRKKSRIGGKLAVRDMLNFIEELKIDLKEGNIDVIIQKFYSELETSGWVEMNNYAISEIADSVFN